jgi:hypothetical protein
MFHVVHVHALQQGAITTIDHMGEDEGIKTAHPQPQDWERI